MTDFLVAAFTYLVIGTGLIMLMLTVVLGFFEMCALFAGAFEAWLHRRDG